MLLKLIKEVDCTQEIGNDEFNNFNNIVIHLHVQAHIPYQ
jgi:hypothetical protein